MPAPLQRQLELLQQLFDTGVLPSQNGFPLAMSSPWSTKDFVGTKARREQCNKLKLVKFQVDFESLRLSVLVINVLLLKIGFEFRD